MSNPNNQVYEGLKNDVARSISNVLNATIHALVYEELMKVDKSLLGEINVSLVEKNVFSREIHVSLTSEKEDLDFYIVFDRVDDMSSTEQDCILYEINDSTVDDSDPEEPLDDLDWTGLAWDEETEDIHDNFVIAITEKLSDFLNKVEVSLSLGSKHSALSVGYFHLRPDSKENITVVRNIESGKYLFDIDNNNSVVGVEILDFYGRVDLEDIKIQLHEVALNEEVDIDTAIEVAETANFSPLGGIDEH